jgi:hypothetical protein
MVMNVDHILLLVALFSKIVAIIFVSLHLVGEERLNMWDIQIKKSFSYAGFKRLLKKGWDWMRFKNEIDNKFIRYLSKSFFILLIVLSIWLCIRFRGFLLFNFDIPLQPNTWFGKLLISWIHSPIYYLLSILDFLIKLVVLVFFFSIVIPIILIYYPVIMVFFIFYRISHFCAQKLRLTSPLLVLGVILLILSEILESVISYIY